MKLQSSLVGPAPPSIYAFSDFIPIALMLGTLWSGDDERRGARRTGLCVERISTFASVALYSHSAMVAFFIHRSKKAEALIWLTAVGWGWGIWLNNNFEESTRHKILAETSDWKKCHFGMKPLGREVVCRRCCAAAAAQGLSCPVVTLALNPSGSVLQHQTNHKQKNPSAPAMFTLPPGLSSGLYHSSKSRRPTSMSSDKKIWSIHKPKLHIYYVDTQRKSNSFKRWGIKFISLPKLTCPTVLCIRYNGSSWSILYWL